MRGNNRRPAQPPRRCRPAALGLKGRTGMARAGGDRSMAPRGRRLTEELIDGVAAIAAARLKPDAAASAAAFIRRYYANVPPEDILGADADTLYGAALALWR